MITFFPYKLSAHFKPEGHDQMIHKNDSQDRSSTITLEEAPPEQLNP